MWMLVLLCQGVCMVPQTPVGLLPTFEDCSAAAHDVNRKNWPTGPFAWCVLTRNPNAKG